MIFPGMSNPLNENASVDTWAPFPTTNAANTETSAQSPMCVTADTSALNDVADDTYQILGSNIGPAGADTVVVADEAGNKTARSLTLPFIRPNFPFQYIGIRYVAGGNAPTGKYQFWINQPPVNTKLN